MSTDARGKQSRHGTDTNKSEETENKQKQKERMEEDRHNRS